MRTISDNISLLGINPDKTSYSSEVETSLYADQHTSHSLVTLVTTIALSPQQW